MVAGSIGRNEPSCGATSIQHPVLEDMFYFTAARVAAIFLNRKQMSKSPQCRLLCANPPYRQLADTGLVFQRLSGHQTALFASLPDWRVCRMQSVI